MLGNMTSVFVTNMKT